MIKTNQKNWLLFHTFVLCLCTVQTVYVCSPIALLPTWNLFIVTVRRFFCCHLIHSHRLLASSKVFYMSFVSNTAREEEEEDERGKIDFDCKFWLRSKIWIKIWRMDILLGSMCAWTALQIAPRMAFSPSYGNAFSLLLLPFRIVFLMTVEEWGIVT